jgi:hypothetical protein
VAAARVSASQETSQPTAEIAAQASPPSVDSPATGPPGAFTAPGTDATVSQSLQARADEDRRMAAADLAGTGAEDLITHLLTGYHVVLPGNPRLVIRVAATWAMLRAVARVQPEDAPRGQPTPQRPARAHPRLRSRV